MRTLLPVESFDLRPISQYMLVRVIKKLVDAWLFYAVRIVSKESL
jgi:hypothetical protein